MNAAIRYAFPLAVAALLAACGTHDRTSFAHFGHASGDRVVLHARSGPDALLAADGSLLVDGKPVALTPAQQALLRDFHDGVGTLWRDAVATGKAGTETAKAAIASVAEGFAGGDSDRIGARVDAAAAKVTADAAKICTDLAALRARQETLAAQLPAFRPYATIGAAETTACGDES